MTQYQAVEVTRHETGTATSEGSHEVVWLPVTVYGDYNPAYPPRKPKRKALRVFEMKRIMKALMGKCVGYSVHSSGSLNFVGLHFDTEADAAVFYRAIAAVDPTETDVTPSVSTG